jgi:hypothetical protein
MMRPLPRSLWPLDESTPLIEDTVGVWVPNRSSILGDLANSWISPPSWSWHRRRRPGGDVIMIAWSWQTSYRVD